ncbi:hypothetical protein MTO96_015947 [Rhipicephalus appendiculatus]
MLRISVFSFLSWSISDEPCSGATPPVTFSAGLPPLRTLSAQVDPCFPGPACFSNRTLFGGPWECPLDLERPLDLDFERLLERALLCECRVRLLDLERPLEPDLDLELLLDDSDTARTPVSASCFERLLERECLLEGVASAPPVFVGAGDTSRFLYSAFLSRLLRRTMYGS